MRSTAIHAAIAKRLLQELDQQAEAALDALDREQSEQFFAAVDARDGLLGQLDGVIGDLTREHGQTVDGTYPDTALQAMLDDVARAASAALASHQRLVAQARRERDRLRSVMERVDRPDAIANQYSATVRPVSKRTLSVTG
jgi:hypothetical protein